MFFKSIIVSLILTTAPCMTYAEGRSLVFSNDPVILVEEVPTESQELVPLYREVILRLVEVNMYEECWIPLNTQIGNQPAYDSDMGLIRMISVVTDTSTILLTIDEVHRLAEIVCWG